LRVQSAFLRVLAATFVVGLNFLLSGCVTGGPPVSADEQNEPFVPSVDPAYRAAKLITAKQKEHCVATIKSTYGYGVEIIAPLRFDPRAAEFVRSKVYHLFNPKTYQESDGYVALITQCNITNIFGNRSIKYCGCFYEVRGEKLEFVRQLVPSDFVKKTYIPI
jgi:hypothetical protein